MFEDGRLTAQASVSACKKQVTDASLGIITVGPFFFFFFFFFFYRVRGLT